MSIESLGADLGIYAGTFTVCFIGGAVPVINSEVWLVGLTVLLASPAPLPAIVVLATAGQILAKSLLFFSARGALELPKGRFHEKLEKARAYLARWKSRPNWFLFTSASLGLPPFYLITLLAGGLGYRYRDFAIIGFVGRVVRFSVVVALAWTGTTIAL